jgi:hypothetical protein
MLGSFPATWARDGHTGKGCPLWEEQIGGSIGW